MQTDLALQMCDANEPWQYLRCLPDVVTVVLTVQCDRAQECSAQSGLGRSGGRGKAAVMCGGWWEAPSSVRCIFVSKMHETHFIGFRSILPVQKSFEKSWTSSVVILAVLVFEMFIPCSF